MMHEADESVTYELTEEWDVLEGDLVVLRLRPNGRAVGWVEESDDLGIALRHSRQGMSDEPAEALWNLDWFFMDEIEHVDVLLWSPLRRAEA